jgi:hypothetical protein
MQVLRPNETHAVRHPALSRFSRPVTASRPRFLFRFYRGASAIAKSLERVENLLAVQLGLSFAESGNIEKLVYRSGTFSAKFVERRIMHHHISRNTLLLCRDSPPLAKIFTQFGIDFCNGRWGCGSGPVRVRGNGRRSCRFRARGTWCGDCVCKPIESAAAGIACVAFFKFWVLAKMRANLAMAAGC